MATPTSSLGCDDLRALLIYAVIQVGDAGTAFLIDHDTALTCSHVFTAQNPNPPEGAELRWGSLTGYGRVRCLRTKDSPDLPDLAILERIQWNGESPPLTGVMLEDIWTEGKHYFSYGHPEGRFPAQTLAFEYEGSEAWDAARLKYHNLKSSMIARPGFSGSPVLNRKTGKVCGVLAINIDANSPQGIRAVPISYALRHFPEIRDRQKSYHRTSSRWASLLPSALAWDLANEKCREMERVARLEWPAFDKGFYEPRAIEKNISRFLASTARGMFIVGGSGMGKSTLLARLIPEYLDQGHLCAFYKSEEIPTEHLQVKSYLTECLGRNTRNGEAVTDSEFWGMLDEEGERREGRFTLIFIDAINEFNKRGDDPSPLRLLDQLDEFVRGLNAKYGRVKLIFTCRPETWKKATENQEGRFRKQPGTYFTPDEKEIAWLLPLFSKEEFEGAYEKYRKAGNIATLFEELSDLAKYHLRDPFLLNLAREAYRDQEIPRELDTGELFEKYFDTPTLKKHRDIIDEMVSEMFEGDPSGSVIQRIAFPRDAELAVRRPRLHQDLNFENRRSPGGELRDQRVIRDWKLRIEGSDQNVTLIRFTYDRFAEYLLSNRLNQQFHKRKRNGESAAAIARDIVQKNLSQSQRTPIVYGSLQRMLFLLTAEGKAFVEILRSISEIDARGQWLVISVLARTARNASGGIEMLAGLLKQLGKRATKGGNVFPVIDSVYRVLRDDDYRLWLAEQKAHLRDTHLLVLQGHFVEAFASSESSVSASAVQYSFFLWSSSSQYAYDDGRRISSAIVSGIGSPLKTALSGSRRRSLVNLAILMILVMSEAPPDRFREAALLSGQAIRRLKLQKYRSLIAFFADSVLLKYLLDVLKKLPHPVQFTAIEQIFNNRAVEIPIIEKIIELLRPNCDPTLFDVNRLKLLATTRSGFAIQMLTFALSVRYERSETPSEKERALGLARDLFFAEPREVLAEYSSSLALYHINYFGSNASKESMQLMQRMAGVILREHHGGFELSGKRHTFNIIGTFGRALHKHGFIPERAESQQAMQYALDALNLSKREKNADFYQYVCSELGLLGVLVEPKYLFDVFTDILKDIKSWEDGNRSALPFRPDQIACAKETMLQSLANIRVLYRQQVDKYLLENLEDPELYSDVTNKRNPDFKLSFFLSWAFEQLMFRCLVQYYSEMGSVFLDSFLAGARSNTPTECVRVAFSQMVRRFVELSQ